MTQPSGPAKVHVVGAGLAGLSAATVLASRGVPVVLSEAARHAGGRCRSYHDPALDMVIDNGNHLVLSGNAAVSRYLQSIGAQDRLEGPAVSEFPFFDLRTGRGWTLRPNDGPVPWWVFDAKRRVPCTRLREYLGLLSLMRRHPGRRIDEVLSCHGRLWHAFLRPVLVSALNTEPEIASADLAGAVMRETLAKGGHHVRPLIAASGLAAAFVDPALDRLRVHGAAIRLGRPLRALEFEDGRIAGLAFEEGDETVGRDDQVILAVPPWIAQKLLPGITTPDAFCAIVNAHFRLTPPADCPPIVGLVGGTAEWVFAFADRLSVTVSAADRLLDMDTQTLSEALWRDVAAVHKLSCSLPPCRIVKEKRATFASTPAQEVRRPSTRTRWKNGFLAGDWTDTGLPATIEGALRSGEAAAEHALAGMGRR
jgi:squalene-associated FAD-dependent desaturase